MSSNKRAPIGIFDSGIGGLTVAKAVMEALPNEHIIYFGDTARVPYGIKSEETVRKYALEITDFLMRKNVKMILIACNTVSASAHAQIVEKAGDIPVLDVITAGSKAALAVAGTHCHIGVIGTLATIHSKSYDKAIHQADEGIEVFSKACPMLVPLAEEGWTDNTIAEQTLHIYLDEINGKQLDSLILGCTHYPLFKPMIRKVLDNPDVQIIDSAISIAGMAQELLEKNQLLNDDPDNGSFHCYVSDKPQRFQKLAERFLGQEIREVEIVNLQ